MATAWFTNAINETGWSYLNVSTNGDFDNYDQAYAAGFVEGYLTQHLIYQVRWALCCSPASLLVKCETMWFVTEHRCPCCAAPQSYVNGGGSLDLPPVLENFLDEQHAWVLNQVAQNPKSDYWQQANAVFGQVQGMFDGYALAAPESETLGYNDIWYMNIDNDIQDLQSAFNVSGVCGDVVDMSWRLGLPLWIFL